MKLKELRERRIIGEVERIYVRYSDEYGEQVRLKIKGHKGPVDGHWVIYNKGKNNYAAMYTLAIVAHTTGKKLWVKPKNAGFPGEIFYLVIGSNI